LPQVGLSTLLPTPAIERNAPSSRQRSSRCSSLKLCPEHGKRWPVGRANFGFLVRDMVLLLSMANQTTSPQPLRGAASGERHARGARSTAGPPRDGATTAGRLARKRAPPRDGEVSRIVGLVAGRFTSGGGSPNRFGASSAGEPLPNGFQLLGRKDECREQEKQNGIRASLGNNTGWKGRRQGKNPQLSMHCQKPL